VADSVSAFLLSYLNKSFSYRRTSERSTEQITLVLCACLKCGEYEVVYEFVLYIFYVELGCACLLSSFFKTYYFRVLSYVTCYADYFTAGIILV
jgi:hypothetical protein